jgi:hypothetical protein
MERIKNENLQRVVDRINRTFGMRNEAVWMPDGKAVWNVGTFMLDNNTLVRITDTSGSTSRVIDDAESKRDLYNQLHVFARGAEAMQAQVLSELKPLKLGDVIKTGGVFLFDQADTNQGETK